MGTTIKFDLEIRVHEVGLEVLVPRFGMIAIYISAGQINPIGLEGLVGLVGPEDSVGRFDRCDRFCRLGLSGEFGRFGLFG
ncbi:unnamed protein product [Protopolystoma xenopodis]|uniref:Uncharacterized protein n=1 Tax=Protopolystoma xenopodis TaxID=117903 RepID=A0A3S4ZZH2_9PLAT|nr:unnamed protein product [Protopolystoma xenopodis]